MSQTKKASRRKRRRRAVPVLSAAGLSLSLAGAAAAAVPADVPAQHRLGHEVSLAEEEIADVSLATFTVVDKENAAPARRGGRLAMGACSGCGGCGCACGGGCWTGTYYTSSVIGDPTPPPQHPVGPTRKQAHVRKGAPVKNP